MPVPFSAETFGMRLTRIMTRHNVTNKALADFCGYKSTNEIVRIRQDAVSDKKLADFMERITPLFSELSEKEMAELREGLLVNRIGVEGYLARSDMRRILRQNAENTAARDFTVQTASGKERLTAFLGEQTENADQVEVLCEGCFVEAFLNAFLPSMKALEQRMTFDHFINMRGGDSPARMLRASFGLLCESGYHLYLPAERDAAAGASDTAANLAFLRVKRDVFERVWLILPSGGSSCILTAVSAASMEHFRLLLIEGMPRFMNIKQEHSEINDSYVEFLAHCLAREKNRMASQLKPDVSFEMIPPNILAGAVAVSPLSRTHPARESKMFEQVYELCVQRHRNLFTKRRLTVFICSMPDMMRFARTGHLKDHVAGVRDFTPDERRVILTELMTQMKTNPFFRLTFLREQHAFPSNNIIAYDGLGVLLSSNDTDYDMERRFSEVFLENEVLLGQVKEYLFRELLERQTLSQEEAVGYMGMLVQMTHGQPPRER